MLLSMVRPFLDNHTGESVMRNVVLTGSVDRDDEPLAFFVGFSLGIKLSLIFWLSVALIVMSAL